jgi:Flp pilus assembly protein TadG
VVEFALVLPILMVVALALVQVGVLARDELLVTQAARAAAGQAAVDADEAGIRSAAVEAAPGLDPADMEVSVARSGGRGEPVTVAVAYEAPTTIPLIGWLFPPSVSLHASATMRQEFP